VPDDHPEDYARQKASAERALFRMHAASGFPAVTVRPPFVHGPRQYLYREQFFWDRLRDTQRTFVEALAAVAGVEPRFVPVPRATIESAGGRLFGEPLYFGEFLDLFPISQVVDKARRLLGFTPTPLPTALAAGFAWYLTQPRRPVDYAFEDRLIVGA
jgi:nucleoside-diphosphate-sugar epimerase